MTRAALLTEDEKAFVSRENLMRGEGLKAGSKASPLLGISLRGSADGGIQLGAGPAAVAQPRCHPRVVGVAGQKEIALLRLRGWFSAPADGCGYPLRSAACSHRRSRRGFCAISKRFHRRAFCERFPNECCCISVLVAHRGRKNILVFALLLMY